MSIEICALHGTQITEDKLELTVPLYRCNECLTWVCPCLFVSKYKLCHKCDFDRELKKLKRIRSKKA